MVDRVLKTSMVYPLNYGFIPCTLCEDGDALDVLVIMPEPVVPMCLVECKPVGVIEMIDNGERDEKILAVPYKCEMESAPKEIVDEVIHFMKNYKQLQKDNKVEIPNVGDKKQAQRFIKDAIEMYAKGEKK
jgi:inorganic pyrophosphatase